MSELYKRIERLCAEEGINITELCRRSGVPRGNMTDLKNGRQKGLSSSNMLKLSQYFNVTIDFLLGQEKESSPSEEDELRMLVDSLSVERRKQVEDYVRFLAAQEGISAP